MTETRPSFPRPRQVPHSRTTHSGQERARLPRNADPVWSRSCHAPAYQRGHASKKGSLASRPGSGAHVEERSAALSAAVPILAVAAVITPTAAVSDRMLSSTSRTMRAYFASPLAPAW